MTICLDASLALQFLIDEPGSERAFDWLHANLSQEFVAPSFFLAEVASVLQRKIQRGEITPEQGNEALGSLESLDIRLIDSFDLIRRAFELATHLNQATVYDTVYLAVAEKEQCSLWTSDKRFVKAASKEYPLVRGLN